MDPRNTYSSSRRTFYIFNKLTVVLLYKYLEGFPFPPVPKICCMYSHVQHAPHRVKRCKMYPSCWRISDTHSHLYFNTCLSTVFWPLGVLCVNGLIVLYCIIHQFSEFINHCYHTGKKICKAIVRGTHEYYSLK